MIDLLINPTVGVVVLEAGESLQRGRGVVLFKMSNGCSHLNAKFLDSRPRDPQKDREQHSGQSLGMAELHVLEGERGIPCSELGIAPFI